METLSSKIRFTSKDLEYLYQALSNAGLADRTEEGTVFIPEDLRLISTSLAEKVEKRIVKKQKTYVMDLNVFEILYIQAMLQYLLPYLGIKAATYENYLFEHRDTLAEHEVLHLRETHSNVFSYYTSLYKLMNKITALEEHYQKDYDEIAGMDVGQRVKAFEDISKQVKSRRAQAEKVIPIHVKQ